MKQFKKIKHFSLMLSSCMFSCNYRRLLSHMSKLRVLHIAYVK